mmetsp:Transcript_146250/g.467266  ORF Transcript_146250/g.467266 Transcript_146250/m.467266 type:complete len:318 (+) Transcript_146250:280-1233(+)
MESCRDSVHKSSRPPFEHGLGMLSPTAYRRATGCKGLTTWHQSGPRDGIDEGCATSLLDKGSTNATSGNLRGENAFAATRAGADNHLRVACAFFWFSSSSSSVSTKMKVFLTSTRLMPAGSVLLVVLDTILLFSGHACGHDENVPGGVCFLATGDIWPSLSSSLSLVAHITFNSSGSPVDCRVKKLLEEGRIHVSGSPLQASVFKNTKSASSLMSLFIAVLPTLLIWLSDITKASRLGPNVFNLKSSLHVLAVLASPTSIRGKASPGRASFPMLTFLISLFSCANEHDGLLHPPVLIKTGHIFVLCKFGAVLISCGQ